MIALPRFRSYALVVASVPAAMLAGAMATQYPRIPLVIVVALGALLLVVIYDRVVEYSLLALVVVLFGYGLGDRGFAYLGYAPLYVGEVAFTLALIAFLVGARNRWRLEPVQILLILFVLWGMARLLPYVTTYRLDALRDGVIWAYVFIALALSVNLRQDHVARALHMYRRYLVPFLLIAPALVTLARTYASVPQWPLAGGPMVAYKVGDLAVHLSGVAAFVLLGLFSMTSRNSRHAEWPIWILWLIGGALTLTGRSALLTVVVSISSAVVLSWLLSASSSKGEAQSRNRTGNRLNHLLPMILIFVPILAAVLVIQPEFGEGRRAVSVDQVVTNVQSIVASDETIDPVLRGTTDWRLSWWNQIIDYTVHGEYFWQGKGFGVNLAADDDVPRQPDLRSPHSIHFNVLARMGVPGLILWTATQVAFAIAMLRAFFQTRRRRDLYWQRINAWIFVYWLAFIINASFDVYLEGPQGGIWFWAVFGFGLAALRIQHDETRTNPDSQPCSPLVMPHARASHP